MVSAVSVNTNRGQVYTFYKTVRINQKNLWVYAHRLFHLLRLACCAPPVST